MESGLVLSVEEKKLKVHRDVQLAENIVIVDGMPGCGKTMMTPIISGFPRVELTQYSYEIEYTVALAAMNMIEKGASEALIRMYADLQLYNVMMSRETNFRWSDLSGVRSNPHWKRYVRRLFQPGDAAVIDRIKKEQPILHLVTHWMSGFSPHLFQALGNALKFVVVVRHPLYMLKQQYKYMRRAGTDPRDFSIWFEYKGQSLPWYAFGWEEKFIGSNDMDRTIYMVEEHQMRYEQAYAELSQSERDRLITVPFERFVTDPRPHVRRIEQVLGVSCDRVTRRALKKQKIPRKMYSDGIDLPIYRENLWEPPGQGSDEAQEFERRRDFAADKATPSAMQVLDRLCADYEERYMRQS